MNELWLLRMKLMNNKKNKSARDDKDELPDHARDSRAAREKS